MLSKSWNIDTNVHVLRNHKLFLDIDDNKYSPKRYVEYKHKLYSAN